MVGFHCRSDLLDRPDRPNSPTKLDHLLYTTFSRPYTTHDSSMTSTRQPPQSLLDHPDPCTISTRPTQPLLDLYSISGERGGSVVECRTPEREVRGSRPTAAVLCLWARHFTPRKYWLITQEAMAPSRHDWKIVDWDVKPQHNQIYSISTRPDVQGSWGSWIRGWRR